MDAIRSLIIEKMESLIKKGVSDEEAVSDYISKSIRLAFVRTMSLSLDQMSDEKYSVLENLVKEKNIDQITAILNDSEMSTKLNQELFVKNLRDIFD